MKTKTILSVCILSGLLYACKKDSVTLEPVYDCMRIENGTAILDDCEGCHKWLVYNYVTHETREVDDTTEVLGENEMFSSPNNPMNPYWNAGCNYDCSGVSNGTAILDDCEGCHKWLVYNYFTHETREVDDTTRTQLGENEMFSSPNNPMNPYWNAGCNYDCSGVPNGTAILDDCEDCHKWLAYNYVTHETREVNDTINEVLLPNEMFTSPNNPMNPEWNLGCK